MTTPTTVQVKLQLRADTAATWASVNPVLLNNELALETDTKKLKVGNGSTAWNSLAYFPFVVSGGTVLGNLEIGTTGTLTFEGSTADGFETTLGVVNPTADRTINLPNQSGTVIVSGNASIVDADISASAEIAVSKLADGAARQLLQTDAAGTGVEWASNIDVPGTLDVTSAATFDSSVTIHGDLTVNGTTTNINTQNLVVEDKNIILADVTTPTDLTADGGGITLKGATDKTITWSDTTDSWEFNQPTITTGSSTAASFIPTGSTVPTNGVYLSGTNTVAVATNSTGHLFVDASGNVAIGSGSVSPSKLHVESGSLSVQRYGLQGAVILRRAEGTTGSPTAIAGNAALGDVRFRGYDGSTYRDVANIGVFSDGAISSTSSPGYFAIGTTPSSSTTPQERLRITSDGKLGLGTSAPGAALQIVSSTSADQMRIGPNTTNYYKIGRDETLGKLTFEGVQQSFSGYDFKIYPTSGSAGTSALVIKEGTGNVGIGTSAPGYKLHVSAAGDQSIVMESTSSGAALFRMVASTQALAAYNTVQSLYGSTQSWSITGNGSQDTIAFNIGTSEKARIDSWGRLLVGTSSALTTTNALTAKLQSAGNSLFDTGISTSLFTADSSPVALQLVKSRNATTGSHTVVQSGDGLGRIVFGGSDGTDFEPAAFIEGQVDGTPGANDMPGRIVLSTTADGASSPTERVRIDSAGYVGINNTGSAGGHKFGVQNSSAAVAFFNRLTDDGTLVTFFQDNVAEGTISVSGTTVSYNGAHLSRWSQLPGGAERNDILRGTVLSNIDEMCGWGEEDNEQLNRMKVSDVEGDPNVSGVFQGWDDDDDTYTDDFYCAMTGDFIIRIAGGVTVERGDLLMSAGDGTAKPQDDDIIRSKTVAKVTSSHVTCTYDDGSYCVPCVLMAC